MSWEDPQSLRDIAYVLVSLVPVGYVVTYKVVAELLGTSPRAVGAFMRANRDLVVVPCHRVVSSRGLGGYSRGVKFKARLLEIEGALRNGRLLKVIRSVGEFWRVVEERGWLLAVDP